MSTSLDEQTLGHCHQDAPAAEAAALGDKVVALVEQFEAAISEGRVPPAFAERLGQLRRTAEDLIGAC
ncbi:hypothetical protein [Sphingomonas hankyongi]|uniref:Uncharacterized protein n=1 Tax=Sphingomonas hankyongi TaxID=2908209 RepID=A0ABT0RZ20_9SPHN|nr:hypothetical protein [Sphingomonas hankyongi]MCL6728631.1 hypothetical protein [Sphingomonas hankyongi]